MQIAETFAAARDMAKGSVGLVPTMGYLHEGHVSLLDVARASADTLVMSLFVNPLQFAEGEDLDRYPRDLERDAAMAETAGVDVLFAPSLDEMYPISPVTRVTVGTLATGLCGRSRPGHFTGVATVVAKLFAGVRPDAAWFGRKDAQQLAVIHRMVADLSFPIEVLGAPIVREHDGLALSSRNVYLAPAERTAALALSRGLTRAAAAVEGGETDGPTLEGLVAAELEAEPAVSAEYVQLTERASVERLWRLDRPAFLAVAARVGTTRLIDNIHLDPGQGGRFDVDRGVRLDAPSLLYGGT